MNRGFQIIAHRGASSECPENSMCAIVRALELGADCVEIDVRMTRTGEWVVIHDETLERFGGGKLKVEEADPAALKKIDIGSWFGSQFKSERMPTLRETARRVIGSAALVLDIKTRRAPEVLAASLLETLAGQDLSSVVFSSFSPALLKALEKRRPGIRLGYLFKNFPLLRTRLVPPRLLYSIHPRKEIFSSRLAAEAKARGLRTFVWTVNQPDILERLVRGGADGVFTDHPGEARRWLESIGNTRLCR
ncbi:MAG: hypothetical protein HY714_01025 [Candidatus Omnitrophica bacterium]|nr:hypothetical protein [Candidatus Omnitrophota bacterium]